MSYYNNPRNNQQLRRHNNRCRQTYRGSRQRGSFQTTIFDQYENTAYEYFGPYNRPYQSRNIRNFRPRNRYQNSRGRRGGRFYSERAKIKRLKYTENVYNEETVYRDDDQYIDPETFDLNSNFRSNKNWNEFDIPDYILNAIEEIGYTYPSKIQSFSIDIILQEGFENFIAQAPNGSGKTGAFIISSLCRLDLDSNNLQIVCISHTNELATQVYHEYEKFTSKIGATLSLLSKFSKPSNVGQILIAVSGSFTKMLISRKLNMNNLKVFIIDEADHLFDIKISVEFYNYIMNAIRMKMIPEKTQFLLFSATYSAEIKRKILELLKQVNEIAIKNEEIMLDLIKHFYIFCDRSDKFHALESILKKVYRGISIVFVNSCDYASLVHNRILGFGFRVGLLMGNFMNSEERSMIMQNFRDGKYEVLVTTNLLARGIDNTKVTCVINLDLPRIISSRETDYELYLHRSGRCSRFGRKGLCFNIVTSEEDLIIIESICEFYNIKINEMKDFNMIETLLEESESTS